MRCRKRQRNRNFPFRTTELAGVLLSLLLLIPFQPLGGTEYRKYSVKSGLSHNCVMDMFQDEEGYLWVATKNGLNRFGGRKFVTFGLPDGAPLEISSMCETLDGTGIWLSAKHLYFFDKCNGEIILFDEKPFEGEGIRRCRNLCLSPDGRLWIAANNGVFSWDGVELCHHISEGGIVYKIFCDTEGSVWVGLGKNLLRYEPEKECFTEFEDKSVKSFICEIAEGSGGRLWLGYGDGTLNCFDKKSEIFHRIPKVDCEGEFVPLTRIRTIIESDYGELLVGADNGLYRMNQDDGTWQKDEGYLSNDSIYSIMCDREGGVWIGTYFSGLNYCYPPNSDMKLYRDDGTENSLKGNAVSQFCEDASGNLWIATENGGLNYFEPRKGKFTDYTSKTYTNNIHALCIDGDDLWIGTFGYGLSKMNLSSGKVYTYRAGDGDSLVDDRVFSLLKASDGRLWVGTQRGLCYYDVARNRFVTVPQHNRHFIYDLAEDNDGNVWVVTFGNGVWCLLAGSDVWQNWMTETNNNFIRAYIDKEGRLWCCSTLGGIFLYDMGTGDFVQVSVSEGLPQSVYYGMLEDRRGRLWLSSDLGIVCYDPETQSASVLTDEDGIQGVQFNYRSSLCTSDGRFYFGGVNGFNSFNPDNIVTNDTPPLAAVSAVGMVDRGSRGSNHWIQQVGKSIEVPRRTIQVEVEYDCLSFVAPNKNSYEWRMLGLYNDWVPSTSNSAVFLNLKPRHYTFEVRACNNDGVWCNEPASMDIRVLPAWWATTIAKLSYALVALFLLASIVKYVLVGVRKKDARTLLRSKIDFFTNVAHEIKTPVSLILAPLEQIKLDEGLSEGTRSKLELMEKNASRLLSLVHELLDFRRADEDGFEVHLKRMDVCAVVAAITESFRLASKDISIAFHCPKGGLVCDVDEEIITKITSNLLSNAVKYAVERIVVTVSGNGNKRFHILVEDDGPGIPVDRRKEVLRPFHKLGNRNFNGFGIGLSLVQLLSEKLGGTVRIGDSSMGGCSVDIELPLTITVLSPEQERLPENKDVPTKKDSGDKQEKNTTILIVDDVPEMLNMLADYFASEFNVIKACDGREALEKLEGNDCDLILSDLMMPRMDGMELLRRVRENELFCHIPFVVLSVTDSNVSKMEALTCGADAYVEKPFTFGHLMATVNGLLENRRLLMRFYATHPIELLENTGISRRDSEWLNRLNKEILDNIKSENLKIETLTDAMGMSRTNLWRKIKGLTGYSPGDYIRMLRLKKAAEMLQSGEYRVNEVCYSVGFSSNSYFTKCFYAQFGINPKDYAKRNHKIV